jgi:hypothetical protein
MGRPRLPEVGDIVMVGTEVSSASRLSRSSRPGPGMDPWLPEDPTQPAGGASTGGCSWRWVLVAVAGSRDDLEPPSTRPQRRR